MSSGLLFPSINAALNAMSAVFLLVGWSLIRKRNIQAHRMAMFAAFASSALFLVSYLTYHILLRHGATPFAGEGWSRKIYFTVLLTHTILAIVIVPLSLITLSRALSSRFDRHRLIARWTLPLWLYVSVTGVVVYVMLYHLFPGKLAG